MIGVLGLSGIAALLILASGLEALEFKPPRILPRRPQGEFDAGALVAQAQRSSLLDQIMFIVVMIIFLAVIFSLLDKEIRAWLVRVIPRAIVIAIFVMFMMNALQPPQAAAPIEATPITAESAPPPELPDIPEMTPQSFGDTFAYGISFALALALIIAAWWLWNSRRDHTPLEEIADAARTAIEEIEQGEEIHDAVIRCYVSMSGAVAMGRGLVRQQGMTPTEFAHAMERAGLPAPAIRTLTTLFEDARYGSKESTAAETAQALACLNDIAVACESRR